MTKIESYKGRRRQPGSLSGSRQSTKGNEMNHATDNAAAYLAVEGLNAARTLVYYRERACSDGLVALLERMVIGSANALIERATIQGETQ